MATFSIPRPVIVGLTEIATLPDESFQELPSAFEGIPLRIRQHRVFDDSTFKLESVSEDEAKGIKEALLPLYSGLATGKVSVETYVNDITTSLGDTDHADLEWLHSEETVSRFKGRLIQLLSIKSLRLIATAHDVLLEHAQTFSSARILSDIRPVFGDAIEDSPEAAVIVHMLNINYFEGGQRHEFVVALDTKDVSYLMETLERAKGKTESLKAAIASTNMTYLDVV